MGGRVLDACAAPGGKATHAAALMGGTGLVLALDRRLSGLRRLVGEARRLGTPLHAAVGDARQPPCRSLFDAVLVDAPCSGLGTLGRHPEVRWRRRPEDIPRLAALQGEILAGVAPLVRPGGVLVYAVCTLTREETDDVVAQFSAAHPRFVVDPLAPGPTVTATGLLRTLPHRHGLDGFFAARLRARG
jgi:16S rRNA (cytosine967-C5)-methyltransferase